MWCYVCSITHHHPPQVPLKFEHGLGHGRSRAWVAWLGTHGWQWCQDPRWEQILMWSRYGVLVGKKSMLIPNFKWIAASNPHAILKSRGPGKWRVLINPYAAMVLKRSCSTSLDELRDLLTYNCPITGKKRCPPYGKENIPVILILIYFRIYFFLPLLNLLYLLIIEIMVINFRLGVGVDARKEWWPPWTSLECHGSFYGPCYETLFCHMDVFSPISILEFPTQIVGVLNLNFWPGWSFHFHHQLI